MLIRPACTPRTLKILENATLGERTVFRFLREAARPDPRLHRLVSAGHRGAGPGAGFRSFREPAGPAGPGVKDWLIDQIEEADPHSFEIFLNRPFPAVT